MDIFRVTSRFKTNWYDDVKSYKRRVAHIYSLWNKYYRYGAPFCVEKAIVVDGKIEMKILFFEEADSKKPKYTYEELKDV